MRKLQLLSLAIVVAAIGLAAPAQAAKKARIKIINQSKWEIHHLYLSPTTEEKWGPDQLGDEVVGTNESFTLTSIECDDYDIRVVDEDGDECVIEDVHLCGDASVWRITDKRLLKRENGE